MACTGHLDTELPGEVGATDGRAWRGHVRAAGDSCVDPSYSEGEGAASMTESIFNYRPNAKTLLRDLVLSGLIGAGIGLVLWFASPDEPLVLQLVASAWIGIWIFTTSKLYLVFCRQILDRLDRLPRTLLIGVLCFLGGGTGFFLAFKTYPWGRNVVLLIQGQRPAWPPPAIPVSSWVDAWIFTGSIGLVVGLLFYRYELLETQLRRSVAALKESEFAEKELEIARVIQRRILPPANIEYEDFRIVARNIPARIVAGDFYDVLRLDGNRLGVIVADVSGKGMGASLVLASVKAKLPFVAEQRSANEMLSALNSLLCEELAEREFVAMAYAIIDRASGEFELANAGLPDPYRLVSGSRPQALSAPGPRLPLGVRRDLDYKKLSARLGPGERLLLFSDGLPEARDPHGEPLGYDGLEACLDILAPSVEEWIDRLIKDVADRTAEPIDDDWTAMVVERIAL